MSRRHPRSAPTSPLRRWRRPRGRHENGSPAYLAAVEAAKHPMRYRLAYNPSTVQVVANRNVPPDKAYLIDDVWFGDNVEATDNVLTLDNMAAAFRYYADEPHPPPAPLVMYGTKIRYPDTYQILTDA